MINRAQVDGVPVNVTVDASQLATTLMTLIDDPTNATEARRYVLAAEAAAGTGAWERAGAFIDTHLASPAATLLGARALQEFIGRLRDVWRLEEDGEVDSISRRKFFGQVRAAAGAGTPAPNSALDSRLDAARQRGYPQTFDWAELLQMRGRATAQVIDRYSGKGLGTGFLAYGGDLSSAWKGKAVFVTNYHVVNEAGGAVGDKISIESARGAAHFTHSDVSAPIAFEKVLWASALDAHDITILSLESLPNDVRPIPLSKKDGANTRSVTVLGHALGGELTFGTEVLDALTGDDDPAPDPRYLHYLATTMGGCFWRTSARLVRP